MLEGGRRVSMSFGAPKLILRGLIVLPHRRESSRPCVIGLQPVCLIQHLLYDGASGVICSKGVCCSLLENSLDPSLRFLGSGPPSMHCVNSHCSPLQIPSCLCHLSKTGSASSWKGERSRFDTKYYHVVRVRGSKIETSNC